MYYIFVKKNYFEAEYWSTLRFSTTILIYTHYFAMKIILIICQGVRLFKTMFIPRHMDVVRQCVSKFALSGFTRTTELSSALILHWRRQARLEECRVSTIMTEAETSAVSQVIISREKRALPVQQFLRRRLNVYWIERTNKFLSDYNGKTNSK